MNEMDLWGQSWCTNLEHYSDYENRLPRGRTYVRSGSVLDLQIAKGEVAAMVAGSELYKIKIAIAPVTRARWKLSRHLPSAALVPGFQATGGRTNAVRFTRDVS